MSTRSAGARVAERPGTAPRIWILACVTSLALLISVLGAGAAQAADSNLAPSAAVTASSQNTGTGQTAAKAIDGVPSGYPADSSKEWSTVGGKSGSWIQLTWAQAVSLNKVVLYDRPNADDRITGATLTFSDGSSVPVGSLTNSGAGVTITFTARTVTWAKLTVTSVASTTFNVGLAEFEAFGSTQPGPNQPPTANAGSNRSVSVGTSVTLDGTKSADSDGQVKAYTWTQTSGASVALSNPNIATPSFTPSAAGTYVFRLVVTDDRGASSSPATVTITVTPPAPNQPPVADPGAAFSAPIKTTVTLDGSRSTDPDGTVVSWAWTQTSGPAVALTGAGTAKPTFTPTETGGYVFSLVVTDDKGTASAPVTVTVTAVDAPIVVANIAAKGSATASSQNTATGQTAAKAVDGVAQGYPADYTKEWVTAGGRGGSWLEIGYGTPVVLTKVVLYDRPNTSDQATAGTLTFSDGSSVPVGALTNSGAGVTVSFPARAVTSVRFTATAVSASTVNVGLAEIEVWGSPAGSGNWPPTANAGASQTVAAGSPVTLDGRGSSDLEGPIASFAWAQTAGPAVALSDATAAAPTFTAPQVAQTTALAFQLTVTDSGGATASAAVTITVTAPATIVAADSGTSGSFTITYDPSFAGRTATLQVQTIATTLTTENPASVWKAVGTVKLDGSGAGKVTVAKPYGATHSYRAVVTVSGTDNPTNVITYAAPKQNKNTGLATVYLNTNEGAAIDSKDVDREGTMTIVAGTSSCTTGTGESIVKTSGRGNYTWTLDKKPYKVNLGSKASLCGMAKSKKWALLANHYDRSLLRTTISLNLGQQLSGLAWTPHLVPVDLYVNGSYVGAYNLIERVEVDSSRVDIDELKDNQTGANDVQPNLSGGYLLEWDYRADPAAGDAVVTVGPDQALVSLASPQNETDGTGVTTAQKSYISGYLNSANSALFSSGFADPVNGWRKYIDEASAVDYYLIQEYTKNLDSNMYTSVYMYKTRDSDAGPGKLFLGPAWDYDTSLGDAAYEGGQGSTSGWYLRDQTDTYAKQTVQSGKTWFDRLNEDSSFRAAVKARWQQLKPVFDGLPASVDQQAALIGKSAAANFSIWDPNQRLEDVQVIKGGFSNEVAYLKTWIAGRTSWMDSQLR